MQLYKFHNLPFTPLVCIMPLQFDAASIASASLHDPIHFKVQECQTAHRLVLLRHWDIATKSKVLELGCGQGDCTTVLASAVGEHGRVVAVDPADLDYGKSSCLSLVLVKDTERPLQVPLILSDKHRAISRKAYWVTESLGSNSPPWSTSLPSPPAKKIFSMQQCSLIFYGTLLLRL